MLGNLLWYVTYEQEQYCVLKLTLQHLSQKPPKPSESKLLYQLCLVFKYKNINMFVQHTENMYILNRRLLNQAHADHRLARAWFLNIDPVWIVGMHVCVCVSGPKAINN